MHSLIVLILSVALVAPALAWDDDGYYEYHHHDPWGYAYGYNDRYEVWYPPYYPDPAPVYHDPPYYSGLGYVLSGAIGAAIIHGLHHHHHW